MGGTRIQYFDILRGLAIIMVMGIHTYIVPPFDSFSHAWSINMRELLNFAVPLFLAISGFFIGQKEINNRGQYFTFLKKQIPRVYIPLLIWSAPMVFLWVFNGQPLFSSVIKGVACAAFGPYYFICLIIQLYLIHPVISKAANIKLGGAIIIICNVASLFLFSHVITHYELPFVMLVSPFIYWIAFYYFGVYFSRHNRDYSLVLPLVLLILGAILQLMSDFFLVTENDYITSDITWRTYMHSVSAWAYELAAVMFLFSSKVEKLITKHIGGLAFLSQIGTCSFGIYLCHVYFLEILNRFGIDNWALRWLILCMVTICFVLMLDRYLPYKVKRILGIN